MILTAVELEVGDRVAARGCHPEYQVASIEAHQGRLQVCDTTGEVDTYHRGDTVTVIRARARTHVGVRR